LVDDFGDAGEFEKDVEAKSNFLAREASGLDDAPTSSEVGPGKVPAEENAELKMVGREEILGGDKSDGAITCLGAWDDLLDPFKAIEPRLQDKADAGIGVGLRKYGYVPARDHGQRLSKEGES
jgi:hypothetical protein